MVSHGGLVRRVVAARRTVVLAGLAICVLVTLVASSALAVATHSSGPVSAVEARTGSRLPDDPNLRRAERVVVMATGFAPRASVAVALVGVATLATVVADDSGAAVYAFAVPRSLPRGAQSLVFSGAAAGDTSRARRGNAHVSVPLSERWPFRVGAPSPPSHGVSGVRGSRPAGNNGHGPTSATGVDVLLTAVAGLVALLLGLGVLRTVGRRRH